MYNELLVNELVKKYGIERTISYCEMKSHECGMIYDECHKEGNRPYEEYMDFGYDRMWWNEKSYELKQITYNDRTNQKSSIVVKDNR